MSLFAELKRRNVIRVAAAYIIVGWLIMQAGEVMAPALRLPDWINSALAFFLILGFPVAMVFAWAFEMTPEGIKRERDVDRSQSITGKTGRKLDFFIIGVLAVAVILLVVDRFRGGDEAAESEPVQSLAAESTEGRKAIAVLPFDNLSANEENAFFAAGVHEDILTYLTRIANLKVNSRTSVMQYAETDSNLKQVAAELGARYIVEGSVRRAGNRVRITAQLIDAETDEHLWADNFDRELTDIFEIQTTVAQEIVDALHAELLPQAEAVLNRRTTNSIEAYDLFLKARQSMQTADMRNVYSEETEPLLKQALEIDPDYAQSWALLAISHGDKYWFGETRTPERLADMKRALDRAFELQPDLPEARLALAAYYYRGFYDYEKALEQLEQVAADIPKDSLVQFNLGLTLRRLGEYDRSIDAFEQAVQLDPGNEEAWAEAINTAGQNRRPARALQIIGRLPVSLSGKARFAGEKAYFYLLNFGDIERAEVTLRPFASSDNYYYQLGVYFHRLWTRDYRALAEMCLNPHFFDSIALGWGSTEAGLWLTMAGDVEQGSTLLAEGEQALREEVAQPGNRNYAWPHMALAKNLSAQGRHEEALDACAETRRILPIERDKLHGPELAKECAYVMARAGRTEEALDLVERLFEIGHDITPHHLVNDPQWGPLGEEPRFQAFSSKAESWNADLRDVLEATYDPRHPELDSGSQEVPGQDRDDGAP